MAGGNFAAGSGRRSEVGEYRQDSAVRGGVRFEPEFAKDLLYVCFDGALGHKEACGYRFVRESFGNEAEHVAFTWRQLEERVVSAAASE